eukprot:8833131-Alexandrium_andersonii.AAC.1
MWRPGAIPPGWLVAAIRQVQCKKCEDLDARWTSIGVWVPAGGSCAERAGQSRQLQFSSLRE